MLLATTHQQSRNARQHAEEQAGVHQRDAHVIFQRVEMRQAVERIRHARRQKIAGIALPVEPHHHFCIKIHSFAERRALSQLQRRGDRIDAESAHAVFQLER
ncbi:hypothetical protein D3C78_800050 [compost metagenome]